MLGGLSPGARCGVAAVGPAPTGPHCFDGGRTRGTSATHLKSSRTQAHGNFKEVPRRGKPLGLLRVFVSLSPPVLRALLSDRREESPNGMYGAFHLHTSPVRNPRTPFQTALKIRI